MLSMSRIAMIAALTLVAHGFAPAETLEFEIAQGDAEPMEMQAAGDAPAVEAAPPVESAPVAVAEVDPELDERIAANVVNLPIFQERVTLDFKNADIQNVIRLIAAKTKLNILMDPDEVEGSITLHLEDVALGDALNNILRVRKLAYIVEQGNIVRIVPESRVGRTEVELQTDVIELNWRDSKDMEDTFKDFLTTNGSLKANEEAQALIITDVPPNILRIKELIANVDRPDRQVVLETRLVDIQIGALRSFQTQYSVASLNKDATGILRGEDDDSAPTRPNDLISAEMLAGTIGGVAPVILEGFSLNGGRGTLQLGTEIGIFGQDYDVNATLQALEQRNVVEVLASPRVTTLNNIQADIKIVERIPYVQGVIGTGGTVVSTVSFEDAGVELRIKPIITPDGHVRLQNDILQRIFRGRQGFDPLDPPIIDERNATTTVIVKDKNTVVLGGLRGAQRTAATSGVPYLHRIPLFGWLFKDKQDDQRRTELVLMVTPHIVEEALIDQQEKNLYDKIDVEWHLPDYFMDDVSTPDDLHNRDENRHLK